MSIVVSPNGSLDRQLELYRSRTVGCQVEPRSTPYVNGISAGGPEAGLTIDILLPIAGSWYGGIVVLLSAGFDV